MSELVLKLGTPRTVTVTGTSAASAAISTSASTGRITVMVTGTVDMHITDGSSPTATTSDTLIVAFQPYLIEVINGEKIAAIRNSASGTLYITEMT